MSTNEVQLPPEVRESLEELEQELREGEQVFSRRGQDWKDEQAQIKYAQQGCIIIAVQLTCFFLFLFGVILVLIFPSSLQYRDYLQILAKPSKKLITIASYAP